MKIFRKKEERFSNSFYEPNISLIKQTEKDYSKVTGKDLSRT